MRAMPTLRSALVPLALLAACLVPSWAAAGPVTYVEQAREIEATIHEVYEFPDPAPDVVLDGNDSASAPDFGVFDAQVTATIASPPAGQEAGFGRISQRSTLGQDGISIAGSWDGRTQTLDGEYTYRTSVDVTFETTDVQAFDLNYRIEMPNFRPGVVGDVVLTRLDGAGGTVFDVDATVLDPNFDEPTSAGSLTGTLDPGRYRFQFLHRVLSDEAGPGPYSVDLGLQGAGTAIPLPPALWPALATAGLVALRLRRAS